MNKRQRAKSKEQRVRAILAGVIFILTLSSTLLALRFVSAATNVNPTSPHHWGWNDVVSWIDFYNTDTVILTESKLKGFASSSIGDISFDCATARNGSICSQSNYKVENDGTGNLSGWAWNDTYGWISFCGGQSAENCPGTISYRVLVDPSTGAFCDSASYTNCFAWNDAIGWISFNCKPHDGEPCSVDYDVDTSWYEGVASGTLESTTFDTGIPSGAAIYSLFWRGALPSPANGASVGFQLAAAADPGGPWSYKGPDGSSNTWYMPSAPDVSQTVDYTLHNARYFRYKVKITSNLAQTVSPRVDEVHVVWSR